MTKDKKRLLIDAGESNDIADEYFTHDSDFEVVGSAVERECLGQADKSGLPGVALDEEREKFPPEMVEAHVPLQIEKDVIRLADGDLRMFHAGLQLVQTSKFLASKRLAVSEDNGRSFERVKPTFALDVEPAREPNGSWDDQMTCYPTRLDTDQGDGYFFHNGNTMGETGAGVAILEGGS